MIYYVHLRQFPCYKTAGKSAFNSLVKAVNFINEKGQKRRSYTIHMSNGDVLTHTPLELQPKKHGEIGIKKDDFRYLVELDQEYLYDNRVNNMYDPFRIAPSSIHIY